MAKFYIEGGEEFGANQMTKAEHEMREKIMAIIAKHTRTFYAGYGYGDSSGVEEDDYDEVADSIMEAFVMVEKPAERFVD